MTAKPNVKSLETLLRAELAELKALRKDMKLIMRRLDAINESLGPISQKAKDQLNEEELEEALFREMDPDGYEELRKAFKETKKNYRTYVEQISSDQKS